MKIAVLITRILLGALLIFSSLNFFFNFMQPPPLEGEMAKFAGGMAATVYMFPLIKIIELLVGILFVTGFFIPLANVILFPISINILLIHLFLAPQGLPVGIFIVGINLFLAYYYRKIYLPLFQNAKVQQD